MIYLFAVFIGFRLGGLWGAIIAVTIVSIVTAFFDNTNKQREEYVESILYTNLPILMAWMCISTSKSKSFVLNVRNAMIDIFGTQKAKSIMKTFKTYVDNGVDNQTFYTACHEIDCTFEFDEKNNLLQIFLAILQDRAEYNEQELNIFLKLAKELGIQFDWSNNNESKNRQNYKDTIDSYNILEISESATNEEVKKQYRKLSKKYHPDLNANLSDKERLETGKRMREINTAYEIICSERGIK